MRYHLVYRKNGRYEPVLEDVGAGIEYIDQGASNQTSQPSEVYLEVPLNASNSAERKVETTPAPFTYPTKAFHPFSKELYDESLQTNGPSVSSPYVFEDDTKTRFKLPISEQYDPDGTKIDWRNVEERIIKKILEYKSKSDVVVDLQNIYDNVKTKAKENKEFLSFKIDDAKNKNKHRNTANIEMTANSIVNESIERAVKVAEVIIKEIDTEINVKKEDKKVGKDVSSKVNVMQNHLENGEILSEAEDISDIPKSVHESVQMYEAIEHHLETFTNKQDRLDDERKLSLIQEMAESIEVGSVRRKSDIFEKEFDKLIYINKQKTTSDKQSSNASARKRAFMIGSNLIGQIKRVAEKSFASKTLLKIFLLYLSNIMVVFTNSLKYARSINAEFNMDKISSKGYSKHDENIKNTTKRSFLNDHSQKVDEENVLRRRKLSGSEMAQLSCRKPEELTHKMDTVISEFHSKLNIKGSQNTINRSDESYKIFSVKEQEQTQTIDPLEWLAKMDKEEREQVKKDIRLAILTAARRIAEHRQSGNVDFYKYSNESTQPMDIPTYIAIVESHVYTNKDAIFDNYISNLKTEGSTTVQLDYNKSEAEYILATSYNLSDHSKERIDNTLSKKTALAEEELSNFNSRVLEESNIKKDTILRTEYVATVTVEHKQVPPMSNVNGHETYSETQKDASEQNLLSIVTTQNLTVDDSKHKKIVIEYKDEESEKTNLEKIVCIESAKVAKDIGVLRIGQICAIKEDQIEPLTITEVTEEIPSITSEEELNTVHAVGREIVRKISAEFNQVDVMEKEYLNLEENKPESVIEENNKLVIALIINKAIIQDIGTVFDEIIMKPIEHTQSKEESAVTIEQIQELAKVIPLLTATVTDLSTSFVVPESIVNNFSYEIEQVTLLTENTELMTAQAKCTAAIYFIQNDIEKTETIISDEINKEVAQTCLEPETFLISKTICTAVIGNTELEIWTVDDFELKHTEEEKANINLEVEEFVNALNVCTASYQDIITPMNDVSILDIVETEYELTTSSIEISVFVTIFAIAMAFISQTNLAFEETDAIESEQFQEEKPKCTEEVREFCRECAICTAFNELVELILEECHTFNVDNVKEEYSSSCVEPSIFTTALPVSTSFVRQTSDVYVDAQFIVIENIQELTAEVLMESEHFMTTRPICTAVGEIVDVLIEESNLFDVEAINEELSTATVEPIKFTKILSIATHVLNQTNTIYIETEELNIETFLEETANICEEICEFKTAQAICIGECQTIFIDLEESNLFEVTQIREQKALERLEPKVYKKAFSVCTETALELDSVFIEIAFREPEILNKECASSSLEVKDFLRVPALCQAMAEQITSIFGEAGQFSVSYDENVQNISAAYKTVETHCIEKVNIAREEIITSSESQQLDTSLIVREAVVKDSILSLEWEDNKTLDINKVDYQHVDTVEESKCLESIDAIKQANVLIKQKESDQQKSKEVTKRQSKLSFIKGEEAAGNVSIHKKTEVSAANSYQELAYEFSLSKTSEEKTSRSIQESFYLNQRSKQSYSQEEFRRQSIEIEQDLEEDSHVVIKEVTDEGETNDESSAVPMVQEEIDIDTRRSSRELDLQTVEVQEIIEKLEDVAPMEDYKNSEKVKAAIDECATLTIAKKEEIEIAYPVLEIYEEESAEMTNIAAQSSANTLSRHSDIQTLDEMEIEQQLALSSTMESQLKCKTEQVSAVIRSENTESKKVKSIKTRSRVDTLESFRLAESAATISQKLISKELSGQSSEIVLKTVNTHGHMGEEDSRNVESSIEIQSPTTPPTPLTDEYVFRLVAPLPKSRGSTPNPIEPEPESSESYRDDEHMAKKNLTPAVESKICERVLYNPSLPTPSTSPVHSPVYTKPGLNGGMKRLPRYIKPGLRGGSDTTLITEEEILEVQRRSSILTSAITETLRNIERYKKEVGILKEAVAAENQPDAGMESDETLRNDEKDIKESERIQSNNEVKENFTLELQKPDQQILTTEVTGDGKPNPDGSVAIDINVRNADEPYDTYSDAFEEVTLFEDIATDKRRDHSETIEECFDVTESEAQITEGVVEFPKEIADGQQTESDLAEVYSANTQQNKHMKNEEGLLVKDVSRAEEEVYGTPDEEPAAISETGNGNLAEAADLEVAKVTALGASTDGNASKGSPALTPKDTDLLKEAHVISLTRVLSAHMLREELSPDRQKIDSEKNQEERGKKEGSGEEKVRSWTTFLQKSTHPVPGQKLDHFADLQNKFEAKELFAGKTDVRIASEMKSKDSSPVPWQERALADTLGAPSACRVEEPVLIPADPPEFLVAIPSGSTPSADLEVSTPTTIQHGVPRIEIEQTEIEDRGAIEVGVDKIVEEALRVAESLETGEKDRLVQLLSTNIKSRSDSNLPVEEQLSEMRSQLDTLAQVPEIIRRALENLSVQLSVISHRRKEESVVHTEGVTQTKPTQAPIQDRNKGTEGVPREEIPQPQIKNEVDQQADRVADKMPAETRGALTVTDSKDQNQARTAPHQPRAKPEPKFGRLHPDTGELILPGGRRWRRFRNEYDEESIAETILAQSEIIQGRALGINFMKYEKPAAPLDHLQRSEVYKLVHSVDQTPPKRVEMLRAAISEADYRERCRSMSPCPPDSAKEQQPSDQLQP